MPFRRPGSRIYQVAPSVVLPVRGRVRLPRRSSGTTRRAEAAAIDATLRELPLMGFADLLERYIVDPSLTPAELHAAKIAGRLEDVRRRAADPLLVDIRVRNEDEVDEGLIAKARAGEKGRRVLQGFTDLPLLLPKGARLSWLADPNNVKDLLVAYEGGAARRKPNRWGTSEPAQGEPRKRNSVRRSLYRAIVLTLDRGLGRVRRLEIMSEVRYAGEDDERKIPITQEDVGRLLREIIDPIILELVRVLLGTGIDLSPALRIRGKHLTSKGFLIVQDGKTDSRFRTFWVPQPVQVAIRRAQMLGRRGPDDLVFQFTPAQVRAHFDAAVARAELTFEKYGKLRVKDCRAIFATAYLARGGSVKQMMQIMGLKRRETAIRYTKLAPDHHEAEMVACADWLGIDRYLELEAGDA